MTTHSPMAATIVPQNSCSQAAPAPKSQPATVRPKNARVMRMTTTATRTMTTVIPMRAMDILTRLMNEAVPYLFSLSPAAWLLLFV
eukprot:m.28728 g.28728  ORF g.28728 m.28728 type:complete len:86 (+) comp40280_c0_seq1:1005-1262(+)